MKKNHNYIALKSHPDDLRLFDAHSNTRPTLVVVPRGGKSRRRIVVSK
jgi:hypothetical protein